MSRLCIPGISDSDTCSGFHRLRVFYGCRFCLQFRILPFMRYSIKIVENADRNMSRKIPDNWSSNFILFYLSLLIENYFCAEISNYQILERNCRKFSGIWNSRKISHRMKRFFVPLVSLSLSHYTCLLA